MNRYSIILPVRNGGEYVKECVNSILAQTISGFNLLVLDNCSEDGTREWIQQLGDERIIIHPADHPLSMEANWGRIIAVEKNEFMTVIGHDDLLHPHYLQTMEELIGEHPQATLYQSHFKFIDAAGKDIRPCLPMAAVQKAPEFIASQLTKTQDSMGTGYMMRSRDYDQLGGIPDYPNLIFADYELWVRLTAANYKATAMDECFSYRIHDSVSRLTNGEAYQQAFGRYIAFLAGLRKTDPGIATVIDRYGKAFLLYFCEALSHRLLKTPANKRVTSVRSHIQHCREWAATLIPGQSFQPLWKPGILAARLLDNPAGLRLFAAYKKLSS